MNAIRSLLLWATLSAAALSGCRQSEDADHVRLAGNLFIFNYREAVATYVISLQRLRPLPPDTHWKATFDNPQGGEPLTVTRKVFPGYGNIAIESDPVYCIVKGLQYNYKIELISKGKTFQTISGNMISTLSQDILPKAPLVIGPGYERNAILSERNDQIKSALKIDRCK